VASMLQEALSSELAVSMEGGRHASSSNTTVTHTIIHPPPIGERSIVMNVSVCVCVGVFVCPWTYICGTTLPIFKFLCMLRMAVARSSSGGVVIRYVLPVLW